MSLQSKETIFPITSTTNSLQKQLSQVSIFNNANDVTLDNVHDLQKYSSPNGKIEDWLLNEQLESEHT